MKIMRSKITCGLLPVLMLISASGASAADPPDPTPADPSKPVKVFLMMGQSNMFGMGRVNGNKGETLEQAVKTEKLYPFLVDDAGNWAERKDVRNVQVVVSKQGGAMQVPHNEWMKVKGGKMGAEYGIGHQLGNSLAAPVMLLRSGIGNRSLGWDLLPPVSKGYDFTGEDKSEKDVIYTYAGYQESPMKWEKGTEPTKIEWDAGKQWDDDIANAKQVLAELDNYCPGATKYEVAGFFW